MKLEQWYKNIVENSQEFPPGKVWEGIQDELDIDLVWKRVDGNLYTRRKKKWMAASAIAASLFFAVAFGTISYYLMKKQTTDEPDLAQQASEKIVPDKSLIESTIEKQPMEQTPANNKSTSQIHLAVEYNENTKTLPYPELSDSNIISPSLLYDVTYSVIRQLYPVSQIDSSMNELLAETLTNEPEKEKLPPNKTKEKAFSFMYVGFSGNLANTWLLNNKTLEGMKSAEFTVTHPSFGKSYGILMGTNLTNRLDITTEFFWISQNKQNYNEYLSGKYVSNKIELDYYTFIVQLKYHLNKYRNSHSLHFGAYSGIMKDATQNLDGIINEISNEYKSLDYGLVIGYEYPLLINSRITFSANVYTKIGLNNVFSGNDFIPYYLNKTRNASLNLAFLFNYSIF